MKNSITLKHPLQGHIVATLRYQEYARFKDIIPIKTDTNVFSYHLKVLTRMGVIKKVQDTYTLGQNGIIHINNLIKNDTRFPLTVCAVLLQNSDGDILLTRQSQQPYINTLSLPMSFVDGVDSTIETTAHNIVTQQIGLQAASSTHVGDAYVRVTTEGQQLSTTLVHVFRVMSDDVPPADFTWVQPHKLASLRLTPGMESIITRSFFGDAYFFEEFEHSWYS